LTEVSNADRVVFPDAGHTKGDVVAYYGRAAPAMLPHLLNRPLTMKRYPRGIGGKGFMQKNVGKHFPDSIGRIELPRLDGKTIHPAVSDADSLMYLANQGNIELHVPTIRAPKLSYPDRLVIDLDPPEGELDNVRDAARAVKTMFDELGAPSTPMTTGSKGYHVIVAITPTVKGGVIHQAMHHMAALLAARHPDLLTYSFAKKKRGGRVFVDWLRNRVPATCIAPWSLRARRGATVAVPIRWDELSDIRPDSFHLADIDQRLDADDPLLTLAAEPIDPSPMVSMLAAMLDEAGITIERFDRFRS
jgi:bifunctional non-homologous end joining protein LigD